MSPLVVNVNYLLAGLTGLGHLILLVFVIAYFVKKDVVIEKLGKYALPFAFLIATLATVGSLFYSEIANFDPCKFCWFQRIFMYPLPLLLGLAWWKKDSNITFYTIPMAIIGGLLALNHYILQITGSSIIPCSAVGQSASCSKRFVMLFGYITIPMMALTAFALIFVALFVYKKYKHRA